MSTLCVGTGTHADYLVQKIARLVSVAYPPFGGWSIQGSSSRLCCSRCRPLMTSISRRVWPSYRLGTPYTGRYVMQRYPEDYFLFDTDAHAEE